MAAVHGAQYPADDLGGILAENGISHRFSELLNVLESRHQTFRSLHPVLYRENNMARYGSINSHFLDELRNGVCGAPWPESDIDGLRGASETHNLLKEKDNERRRVISKHPAVAAKLLKLADLDNARQHLLSSIQQDVANSQRKTLSSLREADGSPNCDSVRTVLSSSREAALEV